LSDEALTEFEKKFIRKVLERNRWNQCKTARALGIHRNTLSKKISTYKLHV
jgi:DNA-binding protein Fis